MKKSLAAIGLSATLLSGGAVGAAMFAPTLAGAQDDAGQVSDESTGHEPGDHLADVLAPLVADGTIDQSQADAVIAALLDARPEPGDRPEPGANLEEITGIDASAWVDGFRNGDSAADIAEANGLSAQELIDLLVTEATERTNQAVEDGRIDQETADERLAEITERITEGVNGDGPLFGGPRFGHHGGFGGGFGGGGRFGGGDGFGGPAN
jgi:hypothetical protein